MLGPCSCALSANPADHLLQGPRAPCSCALVWRLAWAGRCDHHSWLPAPGGAQQPSQCRCRSARCCVRSVACWAPACGPPGPPLTRHPPPPPAEAQAAAGVRQGGGREGGHLCLAVCTALRTSSCQRPGLHRPRRQQPPQTLPAPASSADPGRLQLRGAAARCGPAQSNSGGEGRMGAGQDSAPQPRPGQGGPPGCRAASTPWSGV